MAIGSPSRIEGECKKYARKMCMLARLCVYVCVLKMQGRGFSMTLVYVLALAMNVLFYVVGLTLSSLCIGIVSSSCILWLLE